MASRWIGSRPSLRGSGGRRLSICVASLMAGVSRSAVSSSGFLTVAPIASQSVKRSVNTRRLSLPKHS